MQNDIKRVIAYSTCSQLGYMFVACGVGAYQAGMFHLFTHAFFKALLFLGAGSVIHAHASRAGHAPHGRAAKKLPFTWAMMLIGTLAMTGVGIPHVAGFAGFYSKDAIIEAAYARRTRTSNYAFWVLVDRGLHDVVLLLAADVHDLPRQDARRSARHYDHAHESPPVMLIPLGVLAIGAVFAGLRLPAHYFIGEDFSTSSGARRCSRPRASTSSHDMHEVPGWVGLAPTICHARGPCAVACSTTCVVPALPAVTAKAFRPLYLFLLNKWYFDELYDFLFVRPALWHRPLPLEGRGRRDHRRPRPTAPARVLWWHASASSSCRPATSITTPSPC